MSTLCTSGRPWCATACCGVSSPRKARGNCAADPDEWRGRVAALLGYTCKYDGIWGGGRGGDRLLGFGVEWDRRAGMEGGRDLAWNIRDSSSFHLDVLTFSYAINFLHFPDSLCFSDFIVLYVSDFHQDGHLELVRYMIRDLLAIRADRDQ